MSTCLELVQALHRESGATGAAPATIIGQANEAAQMVEWILDADEFIQTLWEDWKFLKDLTYTYSTVAGTQTQAAPSTLAVWDLDTFRLDGDIIEAVEYEEVKTDLFETTVASRTQPDRVIIRPDNTLQFDPIPDAAYVITADHTLKPVRMTANATVSKIPERYHSVILGKGLMYYGLYENSEDAIAHGTELYDMFLPRLENSQLPNKEGSRYTASGNKIEVIASY